MARRSLWVTDAYFVGVAPYVQAVSAAARDGVDVRLLVPGTSDIPAVASVSRAGYRPLLEAGVRVFEWNGSMLHAKTAVADCRWARVGSSNLNLASWIGNCELDIAVEDEAFARMHGSAVRKRPRQCNRNRSQAAASAGARRTHRCRRPAARPTCRSMRANVPHDAMRKHRRPRRRRARARARVRRTRARAAAVRAAPRPARCVWPTRSARRSRTGACSGRTESGPLLDFGCAAARRGNHRHPVAARDRMAARSCLRSGSARAWSCVIMRPQRQP